MAFTPNDREALTAARMRVLELEVKERTALSELADALNRVPGLAHNANWTAAEVAVHADAIRDALAPFDSGYRAAQDDS